MNNYLHIGEAIVLNTGDIIGIFGIRPENSGFIEGYNRRFMTRNMSEKNKSFALTGGKSGSMLYFSAISSGRLYKRMHDKDTGGINGKEREEGRQEKR
jgi:hypothetical protein